jgi:hypothetical protein
VRDRWHELDNAIGDSRLPASDRAVYHRRLKKADYATAELPAKFTESQAQVARAVGITVRQVRRSERHLERHGWLKISGPTGRGHKPSYVLLLGAQCDCTGRRHDLKADTAAPKGGHGVRRKADTEGGHVAGQRLVSAERQREEETERQPEPDLSFWHAAMNALYDAERP